MGNQHTAHPVPIAERFWSHVDVRGDDECWLWTATTTPSGYGQFFVSPGPPRIRVPAHRMAYELVVGPIPEGLQLDHLCRVRHCTNPTHLEPVTGIENILRGFSPAAIQARQTHCKRGHEFTPQNTHVTNEGFRRCRSCDNAMHRRMRQERKNG